MPPESAVHAQQSSLDFDMEGSQAWHVVDGIEDEGSELDVKSLDSEPKCTISPNASIEAGDKDEDTEPQSPRSHRPKAFTSSSPVTSSSVHFDVSLPSTPGSRALRMPYLEDDTSLPEGNELSSSFESLSALLSNDAKQTQHEHMSLMNEEPSMAPEPRLVMPSMSLPSRRSFSSRGRSMGRLKLLLAGTHGVGKTSLLESIVALNRDIVHVDHSNHVIAKGPIPDHSCISRGCHGSQVQARRSSNSSIVEVYASTKPYPPWWSKLEHSQISSSRRRDNQSQPAQKKSNNQSSTTDTMRHIPDQPLALERNICFVDTTSGCDEMSIQTQRMLCYIRDQHSRSMMTLQRDQSQVSKRSNCDLEGLLSGDGGTQVDVVLYLMTPDSLDMDVACMRKLAYSTNVIALIAKADTLTKEQIDDVKREYQIKATAAGLETLTLQPTEDGETKEDTSSEYPYAVSAVPSNNGTAGVASPSDEQCHSTSFANSELRRLVNQLFDTENMRWTRLSAARKLLLSTDFSNALGTTNALALVRSYPLRPILSRKQDSPDYHMRSPNEHRLLAEHMQPIDEKGQLHVAEWATSLRPFINNGDKYPLTSMQDINSRWLAETLNGKDFKLPLDGITASAGTRVTRAHPQEKTHQNHDPRANHFPYQDPLGLLTWRERLRWLAPLIIHGMVGLASAGLILWIVRGSHNTLASQDSRSTTRNTREAIFHFGGQTMKGFVSHFADIVSFDA